MASQWAGDAWPLTMAARSCVHAGWPHGLLKANQCLPPLQPPPAAAFPADFSRGTVDALLAGIVDASECCRILHSIEFSLD